jgi:hypothetical protein
MSRTILRVASLVLLVATGILFAAPGPSSAFTCKSMDGTAVCICSQACGWGIDYCECIKYDY